MSNRIPESTPDEPTLSDDEIEAAYFPGTVPVLPDPSSDHLNSLRFTDEGWESTSPGVVFVVAGGADQPEADKLRLAKLILHRFPEVDAHSKQIARAFIRDEGTWSVEEVNVGKSAIAKQCDFLVRLTFSPNNDTGQYG